MIKGKVVILDRGMITKIDSGFQTLDHQMGRFRFLSGNTVKMIAIITMFVDHFSKIVLLWFTDNVWGPLYQSGQMTLEKAQQIDYFIRFDLYGIGSIAFPLFCFLLTEGFYYTKDKKRYCFLMGVFAILSEIPFDIAFFTDYSTSEGTYPLYWGYQNIFFTLLLGLVALWCIEKFPCPSDVKSEKIKGALLQIASVVVAAITADLIHCDYGSMGVLFIVGFYICRKNRLYQILMFLFLYMMTTGNQPPLYTVISCMVILLYNGTRGKWHLKYFFYWFYPVHITALHFITVWLATVAK